MKHNIPTADVRAIDVGYFNTKYTLGRIRVGDSQQIEPRMFPSIAPRVPRTQMIGANGTKQGKGWLIAVNGNDYLVGPGAISQISGSEPRPVDEDYCASDKYYALMLGALSDMADHMSARKSFVVKSLVLGLPLTTYEKHVDFLEKRTVGEHSIGSTREPDGARAVTVEKVAVLVQPQGAMIDFAASSSTAMKGSNLVMDAGGGTLDWFMTRDGLANWAKSGAYPKAMLQCALAISDSIDKAWRSQFDIMETIDHALRTGSPTFTIGPREYEIEQFQPAVPRRSRNITRLCSPEPDPPSAR